MNQTLYRWILVVFLILLLSVFWVIQPGEGINTLHNATGAEMANQESTVIRLPARLAGPELEDSSDVSQQTARRLAQEARERYLAQFPEINPEQEYYSNPSAFQRSISIEGQVTQNRELSLPRPINSVAALHALFPGKLYYQTRTSGFSRNPQTFVAWYPNTSQILTYKLKGYFEGQTIRFPNPAYVLAGNNQVVQGIETVILSESYYDDTLGQSHFIFGFYHRGLGSWMPAMGEGRFSPVIYGLADFVLRSDNHWHLAHYHPALGAAGIFNHTHPPQFVARAGGGIAIVKEHYFQGGGSPAWATEIVYVPRGDTFAADYYFKDAFFGNSGLASWQTQYTSDSSGNLVASTYGWCVADFSTLCNQEPDHLCSNTQLPHPGLFHFPRAKAVQFVVRKTLAFLENGTAQLIDHHLEADTIPLPHFPGPAWHY